MDVLVFCCIDLPRWQVGVLSIGVAFCAKTGKRKSLFVSGDNLPEIEIILNELTGNNRFQTLREA